MRLERAALQELPGWSDDLPTQSSRAVLQLLCVHVMLVKSYRELAGTTTALQWHNKTAGKLGNHNTVECFHNTA